MRILSTGNAHITYQKLLITNKEIHTHLTREAYYFYSMKGKM